MPSHRNCCVVNCTNSYYTILKWQQERCEVHDQYFGIGKCTCPYPFTWIKFPEDMIARAKWLKLINRKGFVVKEHTRICSKHFKDGKPTDLFPYPTEHMGYDIDGNVIPKGRHMKRRTTELSSPKTKRSKKVLCSQQSETSLSEAHSTENKKSSAPTTTVSNEPEQDKSVTPELIDTSISSQPVLTDESHETHENINEHSYSFPGHVQFEEMEKEICEGCSYREAKIVKLKSEVSKLKRKVSFWKAKYNEKSEKPFGYNNITKDKRFRAFTGIPTKAAFDTIFDTISPRVSKMKQWRGARTVCNIVRKYKVRSPKKHGYKSYLCGKDEMLLTLMKIRLNLPVSILALLFGVVETSISRIWNTWVDFLAREFVNINPSLEHVKSSLPSSFRNNKYNKVRHIIDCSEIFIETPKNFLTRALTWSEYKHHNTLKFLVSINPNGYICFVSATWGGRASDNHITMNCGFKDVLEPYDVIMADKGFSALGSWFAQHHCSLIVPPGKCGDSQFLKVDVLKTKDIANRRIHMEQAIRRMKTFKIIKDELSISLVPNVDNILKIVQFLSNLLGRIAKV